ncbi:MAG: pilus assembly protein PilM [Phycisphaerae bacterium]|nr:pilus assembly protein PilM [Phycisphaerae bacterium]
MFDVGAAGIRLCQVKGRGAQITISDSLQIDLHPREERGEDTECSADVGRLVSLVMQGRFTGNRVGLILSPPDAYFHALRVPQSVLGCPPNQIRDALAWEIARETRTEAGDLEVRYWPLPTGHREGLNVMAVALPTERARTWVREFAEHHFDLRHLDVSPRALARAVLWQRKIGPEEIWAIVDIGLRRAAITVLMGDTPIYIRTTPIASDDWTRRLKQGFDVPYGEAEELKRSTAIAACGRGAHPAVSDDMSVDPGEVSTVVFGLLRESLDNLVREINMCISYALESYPDRVAGQIYLAGGGSQLGGLADYLALQLGLDTVSIRVAPNDTDVRAEAAAAIGAAILDLEAN